MMMTDAERRFATMMSNIPAPRAHHKSTVNMVAVVVVAAAVSGVLYKSGIAQPLGATLPMMPFVAATALTGRVCGKGSTWSVVVAALILEAAVAFAFDTYGTLLFWEWFGVVAIVLCIVASSTSSRSQPHPPDQSVGIGQRLLIRKRRRPSFPALRQYVVE